MSKRFEELEFTDNFMFVKVLSMYPELCRELLELLLQKTITELRFATYEKTILAAPEAKGIRMDVYTTDEEQTVYNVEMQVQTKRSLPKRSRYYHSINDVELLSSGEDYASLPKSYVIFICKEKPDETCDKPIYTFRSQCQEEPARYLEDDSWTIFVNADCVMEGLPKELKDFLQYIRTGKNAEGSDGLTTKLEAAVSRLRLRSELGVEYMRWEDELRERYRDGVADEHERTLAAERRADAEKLRADAEKLRADNQQRLADSERLRADKAEDRIRQLEDKLAALEK